MLLRAPAMGFEIFFFVAYKRARRARKSGNVKYKFRLRGAPATRATRFFMRCVVFLFIVCLLRNCFSI